LGWARKYFTAELKVKAPFAGKRLRRDPIYRIDVMKEGSPLRYAAASVKGNLSILVASEDVSGRERK